MLLPKLFEGFGGSDVQDEMGPISTKKCKNDYLIVLHGKAMQNLGTFLLGDL